MKVKFISSGPYSHLAEDKDLYDSFDLIGKRIYSPHLLADINDVLDKSRVPRNVNIIFCSEAIRAIESAEKINKNAKIIITPLLNEITFAMAQIITRAEFYGNEDYSYNTSSGKATDKVNIILARRRFAESLSKDKLTESIKSIKFRIENLIGLLNNINAEAVLCITHGFFLQILQLYLNDKKIFTEPDELVSKFEVTKKAFGLLEGFEIDLETFNKNNSEVVSDG